MSREVMKRALEALEGRAVNRYMERLDETIAALRTALAEPERKPLTDEEIVDIWADVSIDYDDQINIIEMARAIERAHGIGGEA